MGLNTIVITLVALGAVAWLAYLLNARNRSGVRDEVPPNLSAYASDDELETKRLDRVLASAVIVSAFMALALPIYYLGENDRQQGFVEEFHETDVEHGLEVWNEFGCANCHGPEGVGGAAPFLEKRSQVNVSWEAPSINDVFYRYDEDEVRFWLVFGRANSPMPAWGLEGGGPLNTQQIDDLMEYLKSIQVPQTDVLAQIDPKVDAALQRIETADQTVADLIAKQSQFIADILAAPDLAPQAEALAEEVLAVVATMDEGQDTDGDGVADRAESQLSEISQRAFELGLVEAAITLDPVNPETAIGTPDERSARAILSSIESQATTLAVTTDNQDKLLVQARAGLAFLEQAAADRKWEIDFQAVADATFGGELDTAQRAVGLFNGYCARCHTAGYSAGPAFQQEQASGALGPSLRDARAAVQFVTEEDLVDFLIKGSDNGAGYGVNGVGSGRMPGWGPFLSQDDIGLIAQYLRGPTLDGHEFAEENDGA